MIDRNKGHTKELDGIIQIPGAEAGLFRDSLLKILDLVKLEECSSDIHRKVQREDIKHIYRLLEYFSKST
ncbi:hypothetical protein [Algoriphagus sp. PAP.12]|uniref:hypothetical protein n=1 Tax=Algoriphagus sp. PAP.12 TaxID=2996678 RepID=UPI00227C8C47|nr:hypothetical protein [Algoriphagus sp. PAP.12]